MKTNIVRPSFFLASLCFAVLAWSRPVVVISIDGLRPDYVTQADSHGLKIPNLRKLMADGSYAAGVTGVVPTVTYPSHTTIVTGVWPSEHGIYANGAFDPLRKNLDGWNWYAPDIKVPTLWEAADRAGIITASVNWPVSVDAKGVKYLIPEFWRARTDEDRKLLEAVSRPAGFLREVEEKLGPYSVWAVENLDADEIRTKFAVEIISSKKPGFMTIHLSALDHAEHTTGAFSKESNETLEALDRMIGRIGQAALANDRGTALAVVSDHGFLPVERHVKLMLAFIDAGLIKLKTSADSTTPSITSWDATFWGAGGSAAVVLRDPRNNAVKARVKAVLDKISADPAYGINRVVEQPELTKLGGFPGAAFLVDMKLGSQPSMALSGPLVTPAPGTGEHGYLPDRPEMRASFFIQGDGIIRGKNLGVVDMRQIAPTLASLLGVSLPTAKESKLPIER